MSENIQTSFIVLKNVFGTHGAAAKYLGLSRDHYCALRNGRVPIPRRTAELIILKARQVDASLPLRAEAVSV